MVKMQQSPQGPNGGVTLKDIATAVGVSAATVSRVLSFDSTLSVSDKKRKAILETAEALNYETPRQRKRAEDMGAGQTLGQITGKIALVNFLRPKEELSDPYYVALRLGIERRCGEKQLEYTKAHQGAGLPDAALLQGTDGAIVIGWHAPADVAWLRQHTQRIVFADFLPGVAGVDAVASDIEAATQDLLSALAAQGYRRIGFMGWVDGRGTGENERPEARYLAYESWMRKRGWFDPTHCALGEKTEEGGYHLALHMMNAPVRPEVLVTANDNMAVGVYRALHKLGLQIPQDIGVASFNDNTVASFMNPPLTTVRLPAEEIGETAVDLLIERLAGRDLAKRVILESRIIWRGSARAGVPSGAP
jgi:LacI family transcriptional regulator